MKKLLIYLFCSIPLLLISGPFLSGLVVSILGFYGLTQVRFWSQIKENKTLKFFFILFILFYLYIIFSSYLSLLPEESYKSSLLYFRFFLYSLGVYFLISEFRDKIYIYFTTTLIISFILVVCSLIFELVFSIIYNQNIGQFTGIFFDEQIAGSYIARLYPLLIGFSFLISHSYLNKYKKSLIISIFLISLLSVFLSGERSSIFIYIMSNFFLVIGCKQFRDYIFDIRILLISAILILFVSFTSPSILQRVIFKTAHQLTQDGEINIFSKHHESHIKTAINMFNYNKVFGVGPRMFRHLCDHHNYRENYNREIQYTNHGVPKHLEGRIFEITYNGCSTHPHNHLIQILAETGIIGLIFYLTFITYIFFQLFKLIIYKRASSNIILFTSLICLFCSFFPFQPSGNFFGSYINIFYFLFLSFYLYEINEPS